MHRILALAMMSTLVMAVAPQQATAQNALGGAIFGGAAGAIIGGAAGGSSGAAIGAGIGAATGAIIAAQGQPRSGGYYYWRRGCYMRRPYGWVRVESHYCYSGSYYYRRAPVYRHDIAETQRLLNELGYDVGPVDGEMGPATRLAIRSFQRDAGLPITGEFDFALLNQLRSTQKTQSRGSVSSPAGPGLGLDCRQATTATEGAICASPKLAVLDQQLKAAYRAAIAGLDAPAAARLRNAQQRWIPNRNSCGADTACIATAYRRRIAALNLQAPPTSGESSHAPPAAGTPRGSRVGLSVPTGASPSSPASSANALGGAEGDRASKAMLKIGSEAPTNPSGMDERQPPNNAPIGFYGDIGNVVNNKKGAWNYNPLVVRPSDLLLAEDGSVALDHLRWTGWGMSVARATGVWSASDCTPSCAGGKRRTSPARLTLSSPGIVDGHRVYRCFQVDPPHPQRDIADHGCLHREGALYGY